MSEITTNVVVANALQIFTASRSFKALANGRIYVGEPDTDPTIPSNQKVVYLQNEDGTSVPIPQPLVINAGGHVVYSGQLVRKLVTEGNYSLAIYDAYGTQEYYFEDMSKLDPEVLLGLLTGDDGASIVGWKRDSLKGSISNVHQMLDAQYVNVWEFANLITTKPDINKPETWDWTPAFQAALNSVSIGTLDPGSNGGCVYIPAFKNGSSPLNQGVYKITQLEVPQGVAIIAYGSTLAPFNQADVRTHLIKFAGMNKVSGLQIAMDYSLTYECAIWCVGPDNGGRNSDFVSCAVWFSKNAVTIGDPSWLQNPTEGWRGTSEVSFTNCQFNWCLRTATAYGLNTIVTFGGGSRCYANRGSISPSHPNASGWASAPMGNFLNYGALIYVVGAFIGTFERDIPSLTSRVMPVSTTDYVNSYGRYFIEGCHIETSYLFFAPAETAVSADVITKSLVVHNCHGHVATSPADNYWIAASSQMTQAIDIRSCGFYGTHGVTPTRTKLLSAPGCPVHITKDSFNVISEEFKDCNTFLYPSDFSSIMLVNAFGSNQSISTTSTTLVMPSNGSIDLNNSARGSYYSVGTGAFTAAVELNNVELTIDLRYSPPNSANQVTLDLMVSGVVVDSVVMSGGYPRGTLRARRITKGSTFLIRMIGSATYTLDGSANTKLTLVANV